MSWFRSNVDQGSLEMKVEDCKALIRKRLEREKERVNEQEGLVNDLKQRMEQMKTVLYSKFGDSIQLEMEEGVEQMRCEQLVTICAKMPNKQCNESERCVQTVTLLAVSHAHFLLVVTSGGSGFLVQVEQEGAQFAAQDCDGSTVGCPQVQGYQRIRHQSRTRLGSAVGSNGSSLWDAFFGLACP